jgi:hypothetical protein
MILEQTSTESSAPRPSLLGCRGVIGGLTVLLVVALLTQSTNQRAIGVAARVHQTAAMSLLQVGQWTSSARPSRERRSEEHRPVVCARARHPDSRSLANPRREFATGSIAHLGSWLLDLPPPAKL